jgi:hypothetical protein
MKIKVLFLLLTAACSNVSSYAQTATGDEREIQSTIVVLFMAMQMGDSTMARNTFAKDVTTASVSRNKNSEAILVQENSIADFMKAIGSPHEGTWYEEMWDLKIEIDGDFSQAWCNYAFYIDNKFSHCGVDAFHLYRAKSGWKIFHLADTRRKTDCNVPDEIAERHKQD